MFKKLNLRENAAHLCLLLIGSILLIGGCFQNSIWFDEAYTVGLVNHSLPSLLKLAAYDVHPHLYYVGLKLFTLLFGNSIPVMRLFSAIGGVVCISLGFTHVRKDFGKAVGFWFSFCTAFCASTLVYALQIRMYTWAFCFVALTGIYAFRYFNNPEDKKSRRKFLVFSLCAAYTHYFALFTVAAINVVTLVANIKKKNNLKKWWIDAAIQIGLYLPGAAVFLYQILQDGANWLTVAYPDVVFDLVSYHFLGDFAQIFYGYQSTKYLVVSGLFLAVYVIGGVLLYRYYKSKQIDNNRKSALKSAAAVYFGVILFALTVSLFRVIYYIRYTVVIGGFLFFMMALLISQFRLKAVKAAVALAMIIVFANQAVGVYKTFYDPSSNAVSEALDGEVTEEDDFIFEDIKCYIATVQYPSCRSFFYNSQNWQVHKAYQALAEESNVVDRMEYFEDYNLSDRVWVADRGACYEYLRSQGYEEIKSKGIHTVYYNYHFDLILMIKQ